MSASELLAGDESGCCGWAVFFLSALLSVAGAAVEQVPTCGEGSTHLWAAPAAMLAAGARDEVVAAAEVAVDPLTFVAETTSAAAASAWVAPAGTCGLRIRSHIHLGATSVVDTAALCIAACLAEAVFLAAEVVAGPLAPSGNALVAVVEGVVGQRHVMAAHPPRRPHHCQSHCPHLRAAPAAPLSLSPHEARR